jgi:hypothetical protein
MNIRIPQLRNHTFQKQSYTLRYATLLYASTLLYATLRHSTLLYATLRYSTLLYATLRYSTLLYATLRYSTQSSSRWRHFFVSLAVISMYYLSMGWFPAIRTAQNINLGEKTYFSEAAKFSSKNATVLLYPRSATLVLSWATKSSTLTILCSKFLPPTWKENKTENHLMYFYPLLRNTLILLRYTRHATRGWPINICTPLPIITNIFNNHQKISAKTS